MQKVGKGSWDFFLLGNSGIFPADVNVIIYNFVWENDSCEYTVCLKNFAYFLYFNA